MDRANVYPEQRVWQPRVAEARRVREARVGDEQREQREYHVEAKLVEPIVRVLRVDLAIGVTVPEEDVLLQDGVVLEPPRVVLLLFWCGDRHCHIGARRASS